jgi:hypothetical protein
VFLKELNTDLNGFVLFDPRTLTAALGREPAPGEDLYALFTKSDDGDKVVKEGAIVPILGITDATYNVCVRMADEPGPFANLPPYDENAVFPLHVEQKAYVADLAVLAYWEPRTDWHELDLPSGCYGVAIRAYLKLDAQQAIEDCGYEFVLERSERLPAVTGDLAKFIDLGNPRREPPMATGGSSKEPKTRRKPPRR